jgi:hypothetical protein
VCFALLSPLRRMAHFGSLLRGVNLQCGGVPKTRGAGVNERRGVREYVRKGRIRVEADEASPRSPNVARLQCKSPTCRFGCAETFC